MSGEPEERGVVYLSHIPHGFYEPQMISFFEQFGKVTRCKLWRSKKVIKCLSGLREVIKTIASMPLVIALMPLESSSRNLQFPHRVPFTKEKIPLCPRPFQKNTGLQDHSL